MNEPRTRTRGGNRPRRHAAGLLGAAALLGGAAACGDPPARAEVAPLLLIGVDGLEWELVLRFGAAGDLPNLMALAREGFAARLETIDPTISPVVWTTIATGKRPEKHGITGFSYADAEGRPHLFLSLHRRSKALWNLFDDAGLATRVFGWWCTLPVEPIRGAMVAQSSLRAQIDISQGDRIWKGTFLPVDGLDGQVHPEELAPRMVAIANALADRAAGGSDPMAAAFGAPAGFTSATRNLWDLVRGAFYADCVFRDGALDALERREPFDALLVYFGVPDVASHLFWRHFEPEKFDHPPPAAEVADFGRVIRDSYRFVDDAVGALRRAAPGADLLVISDHGFRAANVHLDFNAEGGRIDSGHHLNQPPGVLIAAGRSFRRSPLPADAPGRVPRSIGRVEDVLPTLLARAGIAYGQDMDGRPMQGLLAEELLRARPITEVKSHEDGAWRAARMRAEAHALAWERNFEARFGASTPEELARLRALGYAGPGLLPEDPAGGDGR